MLETPNNQHQLLGIFGGTFDPVHHGHIHPLLSVQRKLGFDKTLALPCYIPPHKAAPSSSANHRIAMLELGLKAYPWIEIDKRELCRNKPSYTYDTLIELNEQYPEHHLCFIIGMDSMINFDTWYRWQDILALCHLIVMQRGGYIPEFNDNLQKQLVQHMTQNVADLRHSSSGKILFVDTPEVDMSSSQIRHKIRLHQSIDGMVPEEVIPYIQQHGLYL